MFKNVIILILIFLLCSLLIQKPKNAELLIKNVASIKAMVVDGTYYLRAAFIKEFPVIDEAEEKPEDKKVFRKETFKDKIDLSNVNPNFSNSPGPSTSLIPTTEQEIIKDMDRWFNEPNEK